MQMTFRWYGNDDPVTLEKIRQIPCIDGVVTAVYSVPVGEVWPEEAIAEIKNAAEEKGLKMEVIESVPVHEDIKLKRGNYQLYIDGKMELRDLNMSARIYYQKAHPENDGKTSCMSNLQEGLRGAALCEGNKKIAVGNWNIW